MAVLLLMIGGVDQYNCPILYDFSKNEILGLNNLVATLWYLTDLFVRTSINRIKFFVVFRDESGDYLLEKIRDSAGQKGTGKKFKYLGGGDNGFLTTLVPKVL